MSFESSFLALENDATKASCCVLVPIYRKLFNMLLAS